MLLYVVILLSHINIYSLCLYLYMVMLLSHLIMYSPFQLVEYAGIRGTHDVMDLCNLVHFIRPWEQWM